MPIEFKLPDLGEGVAEGEIVEWRVRKGEAVVEDQPMVEVMTDKATVEIPCPVTGRVLEILAREGAVIPVGTPMILLEDGAKSDGATGRRERRGESTDSSATEAQGPAAPEGAPPHRAPRSAHRAPRAASGTPATPDAEAPVRAVPLVRRVARELNVDLATVAGTGPAGRITEADVRAAAEGVKGRRGEGEKAAPVTPSPPHPLTPSAPAPSAAEREERRPFRGIRRRIAERLVESLRNTAPFTFVDEVDMTEIVAVREQALPWAERRGVKLSYLPFIVKAAVAALRAHPELNAMVDEEAGELVLKRYYNIGIATHTEEGLVVPVVRDADRKSLWQLAAEIEALATKARGGALSREDLLDSTFTITSLGVLGGLMATPIINPPEVAILGVHQIRPRPAVRDGQIVVRQIAHLSLTFDHRVVDGYDGAAFVRAVIGYLEHPALLMLAEES